MFGDKKNLPKRQPKEMKISDRKIIEEKLEKDEKIEKDEDEGQKTK